MNTLLLVALFGASAAAPPPPVAPVAATYGHYELVSCVRCTPRGIQTFTGAEPRLAR